MTAPSYEYKNENTIQSELYIPLLADKYTVANGAENPDFVALSNTIGILEGARNSVLPSGSFISHTKSTPASSLTGLPAKRPILALRRMAMPETVPRSI